MHEEFELARTGGARSSEQIREAMQFALDAILSGRFQGGGGLGQTHSAEQRSETPGEYPNFGGSWWSAFDSSIPDGTGAERESLFMLSAVPVSFNILPIIRWVLIVNADCSGELGY